MTDILTTWAEVIIRVKSFDSDDDFSDNFRSKCQSLSPTTVLFWTTITRTITLHDRMKLLVLFYKYHSLLLPRPHHRVIIKLTNTVLFYDSNNNPLAQEPIGLLTGWNNFIFGNVIKIISLSFRPFSKTTRGTYFRKTLVDYVISIKASTIKLGCIL